MPILECPACRWLLVQPESKVGIDFSCLNCNTGYNTAKAQVVHIGPGRGNPPPAEKAPSVTVARTVLTRSHLCSNENCGKELKETGQRYSTRECPHCQKPTSLYAVLHRCPECDTLLETPRRCMGSSIRCPLCMEPLTVPSDILHNDERVLPDHTWLGFRCPGCQSPLQAPSAQARQEAGCPNCNRVLTIPCAGERVAALPAGPALDIRQALHTQLTKSCPKCNQPSPRQALVCRLCGGQLP